MLRSLLLSWFLLISHASHATEALPYEFLSAPLRVKLYMAYAEFKMAHHTTARLMWEHLDAEQSAEAAFNLGILYEQGLGLEKDIAKSLQLYERAGKRGSRAAAYQLGLLYKSHPEHQNKAKAHFWLTTAAIDGDHDAAMLLEELNNHTDQVSDPITKVNQLLIEDKAAEAIALLHQFSTAPNIDYRAVSRLAWLYEAGIGVERDLSESARLFLLAAQAGRPEAQYAIAVMSETGKGQPQNTSIAKEWLYRSACQQYPPALQKLSTIELNKLTQHCPTKDTRPRSFSE